ncbi:shikimate kinase [Cryptobacterium curtum DSM 15641]|uniref:Shikimate kinase n=2 Tax=Cryptobacterium TaxID=84162 RepID=C7ML04_CRYCD|nr:shikimate kinase [Cryptobacterium curtum]ACU94951.1 shikimate kinase [Cryptobacterium curtum DSM 15641]
MVEKDNIVLIGMPGAGKSTLGIVLAKILGFDFIDADLLIQNQSNKTLQKILDACGPTGFIQVENEVLCGLEASRTVIATGGSAVYSDEAMKHLMHIGTIVYLKTSLEELTMRLGGLYERGVVMKDGMGMSLSDLYEERIPLYEQYAEVTLDLDGMSVRDAARKLVDILSLQESNPSNPS